MTPPRADLAAARRSLEGLSLGDAFGERWFPLFRAPQQARNEIRARRTPAEPVWHWTDDTAMARALQRVLDDHGEVDQDRLATCFALTYDIDPARGYGHGMHILLPELLTAPADWRTLAPDLFEGGSLGNGAAMRVAPLGARFHADLDHAARQAQLSAEVTHAHPQGIAGAVAVAVAAALQVRGGFTLTAVADRTPEGPVRGRDPARIGRAVHHRAVEGGRSARQRAAHPGRRHRPVRPVDRGPASGRSGSGPLGHRRGFR